MIELVVALGIMTIITAVILANNSRFGGMVTLRSLSYDVALTIRQAQTYGISVRRFGATDFQISYGIHLDTSSPTLYVLFADGVVKNGFYDAGEIVESETIGRGFAITDLCAKTAVSSIESCGLEKIDILFTRPEPDALIKINGGPTLQERARIELGSPQGNRMSVIVEATGQIAVQ